MNRALESTQELSHLPVDKDIENVQASPLAKSLWNNIIEESDVPVSKEWQSLCFENIVKLYATLSDVSLLHGILISTNCKKKQKKKALQKQ